MFNLYCESIIQYMRNCMLHCIWQTHLWVVPPKTPHVHFIWHIELFKNMKRSNKYFHYIFWVNTFIRLYRIWNFNMSRLFCLLMFLIVLCKKSFKISWCFLFLNLLVRNTCVWNMCWVWFWEIQILCNFMVFYLIFLIN
jgi:hypothetical protein